VDYSALFIAYQNNKQARQIYPLDYAHGSRAFDRSEHYS